MGLQWSAHRGPNISVAQNVNQSKLPTLVDKMLNLFSGIIMDLGSETVYSDVLHGRVVRQKESGLDYRTPRSAVVLWYAMCLNGY